MAEKSNPGLLFVAADVDPAHEADFNRWYDSEHVEERARIPGFLSSARYRSVEGGQKYLGLYRTASLAVFGTPAYQAAFQHQTAWSVTNLGRMRNAMRRVCEVRAETGFGTGSHIAILRTEGEIADARAREAGAALAALPGVVHSYLLVPDTALSTPLPQEQQAGRVLAPLFVVESTALDAARAARDLAAARLGAGESRLYALGWQLTAQDLAGAAR